jgi:TonB family protein
MPVIVRFGVMTLGLALAVAGCGAPPTAEVDAAKAAVDTAASERAGQYAGESLKAAQEAQTALEAELKAQEGKLIKSYDRTRELAAAAKAAGDKAAAEAVAGRERAEAVAAKIKAAAAARAKAKAEAVKVGGAIRPPTKIKHVDPVYPAIAKSARVSGTVVLEATIGPDGKVIDTRVVKSVTLLDQAAIDAVQQWEYTPTVQKGATVPIVMTITVNFTPK